MKFSLPKRTFEKGLREVAIVVMNAACSRLPKLAEFTESGMTGSIPYYTTDKQTDDVRVHYSYEYGHELFYVCHNVGNDRLGAQLIDAYNYLVFGKLNRSTIADENASATSVAQMTFPDVPQKERELT